MFEVFRNPQSKEEKRDAKNFKMQTDFAREQTLTGTAAQEEQTEILEREIRTDLIKWQQDLDPELESLAFKLTGWVKRSGEWIKTEKTPLVNDKFMEDVVIVQLDPWLSKNLINSKFTEERILMNLKHTSNEIADNMADNFDAYDIQFTNFDLVLRVLKTTMQSSGFRALQGWTKNTDSKIIKRIESSHDHANMQEKKKGLFSV